MTDTPPDWVLLEAAKRSGWFEGLQLSYLQRYYTESNQMFRALCDMILKHEQPPVDRKLLCAREARDKWATDEISVEDTCLHAIELYESGFGK